MEYGGIVIWWLGAVTLGLLIGAATKRPKEGALWTLLLGPLGLGIFIAVAAWKVATRPST